jgi:hypothetical protein
MAEMSRQATGSAAPGSGAERVENADAPSRPRPKVLIPPVATAMPADPPPSGPQRTSSSKSKRASKAPADTAAAAAVIAEADSPEGGELADPVTVKTFRAPASRPGIARVHLTHVDPWSVMKQAFLLSLAIAIVILVACAALWFALDSAGVFAALTRTATDVGGEGGASLGDFLSFSKIMGVALVLAGIETILVTALVTLFAFLYNLAVGIGGGLEVTLSEEG